MVLNHNAGAHAQQLSRAVAEAACATLAAAWRSGDQAGVKAAFLPLSDVEGFSVLAATGTERQVTAWLLHHQCFSHHALCSKIQPQSQVKMSQHLCIQYSTDTLPLLNLQAQFYACVGHLGISQPGSTLG